jgi:hypothetical protein
VQLECREQYPLFRVDRNNRFSFSRIIDAIPLKIVLILKNLNRQVAEIFSLETTRHHGAVFHPWLQINLLELRGRKNKEKLDKKLRKTGKIRE